MSLDTFTTEVVQEQLLAVVREMRVNLVRSAHSLTIYEAQDFSCGLLDRAGELVAQGEDNPGHVFPLCFTAQGVLKEFGENIRPGDIFMHNNPYDGGTHLNDVAIAYPIFLDGELVLVATIRAHWDDVGGMSPGSINGTATEIFQEGFRIPIVRIYDEGRPNETFLKVMFANMRSPHEREGDFHAMLGACRIAADRVHAMGAKYGRETLINIMALLLERAEERIRMKIRQLPDWEGTYQTYLDSSGNSPDPVLIKMRVTVKGDEVTADFEGSSPQVAGPTNVGPSLAPTGVFIVLKSFLDADSPVNGGSFRPIHVITPPGTVVNATYPTPCGGTGEIRRTIESCMMGVMATIGAEDVTGDLKGAANHTYVGGWDHHNGRHFLLYEFPAGGTGAFEGYDGNNGCTAHCTTLESIRK